jgi:hypothetical protein
VSEFLIRPITYLTFSNRKRKGRLGNMNINRHTFGARTNMDLRVSSLKKADVSEKPVAT